jgi:alanyl-tRNA synthetase
MEAYGRAHSELTLLRTLADKVNSPVGELEKKLETLVVRQKDLEKQIHSARQREASIVAGDLKTGVATVNGVPLIARNLGAADGDFLQAVADALKGSFKGVVVLGGVANGAVSLVAAVSPEYIPRLHAGKIIQKIAAIVGGKGGGKPDNARGGGKEAGKLDEALGQVKSLVV